MTHIGDLAVVVPANDEEALIGECLTAIRAAVRRARELDDLRMLVIIVLDACTDATAAVVAQYPEVDAITVDFRNVGAARAAGIEHALAMTTAAPEHTWIANTDADSRVPEQWVLTHLALAREGAGLVLGSIRPDPRDLSTEQYRAWEHRAAAERSAGASPVRIHGANLGVRADAYLAVGGFAPLAVGEDVELTRAVRERGERVVVSDVSWVQTSARTRGRAPGGFAEYVRLHY